MGKYGKRAIVILAGICLWIFYIFQEELSRYSLYTVISYNIHEIASVIPFLCIGIAAAWCVYLFVKVIKKQSDRYDHGFLMILLAAVILMGLYIYKENSVVRITVIASVESVDEQNGEIVIIDKEGQKMTLQSPDLVNRIIETDGQKYLMEYDINFSGTRKLRMISLPENQKQNLE